MLGNVMVYLVENICYVVVLLCLFLIYVLKEIFE